MNEYIKPSYKFAEINSLMKLPLEEKVKISVEVIGEAVTYSRRLKKRGLLAQ